MEDAQIKQGFFQVLKIIEYNIIIVSCELI